MAIGLIGRKCGMTRIFTEAGAGIPVTVIQAEPNRVTQVKANAGTGRGLWELRVDEKEVGGFAVGAEIKVDTFAVGDMVDVTGVTKGKGFAGTIKRHNFKMGDATHGNSLSHRSPGSLGQRQTPGRVFPGKKMAGHMGDVQQTTQNLKVVRIDLERHLIMVSGPVPGATNGDVVVKPAAKG